MEYQQGLTIIGSVCVVLLLLLAGFFATVRSSLTLSNRLFAGFLLLTAVDLSGWISGLDEPLIAALRLSLTFLQMPVLLLYVSAACFSDFRLRPAHMWHAVPFVVALQLLLFPRMTNMPVQVVLLAGLHGQYYLYIAAAFLTLWRFRVIFRDTCADPDSRTFSWLFQLCIASLIAHTFVLARGLALLVGAPVVQILNVVVSLIALAVTVWFAAKALYQPNLFRRVEAQTETPAKPTYELTIDASADLDRLRDHMRRNAPFVDANLSLKKLARQMSMPARDLSVLINGGLGQSFFEFINAYRIDRAAEMLSDPARSEMSVLDVLYEVGFNSKSSFNTAFKRRIGQTPSAYRRDHLK